MPRLSDSVRDERRTQILDAARACVDEHGLESVSMEMIVARSGMSTGAVYRYFTGKDDIIRAALLDGAHSMFDVLRPILTQPTPPPPADFLAEVLRTIVGHGPGSTDPTLVAVHAWSHSRSDEDLRADMQRAQRRLRTAFTAVARTWQAAGTIDSEASASAIGQLLLSLTLGFVAQRTLAGNADPAAHAAALDALTRRRSTRARR